MYDRFSRNNKRYIGDLRRGFRPRHFASNKSIVHTIAGILFKKGSGSISDQELIKLLTKFRASFVCTHGLDEARDAAGRLIKAIKSGDDSTVKEDAEIVNENVNMDVLAGKEKPTDFRGDARNIVEECVEDYADSHGGKMTEKQKDECVEIIMHELSKLDYNRRDLTGHDKLLKTLCDDKDFADDEEEADLLPSDIVIYYAEKCFDAVCKKIIS